MFVFVNIIVILTNYDSIANYLNQLSFSIDVTNNELYQPDVITRLTTHLQLVGKSDNRKSLMTTNAFKMFAFTFNDNTNIFLSSIIFRTAISVSINIHTLVIFQQVQQNQNSFHYIQHAIYNSTRIQHNNNINTKIGIICIMFYYYFVLVIVQHILMIILYELSISILVLMDIIHLTIAIDNGIMLQLDILIILIQWIIYDLKHTTLLLLLLLWMDMRVIHFNYDLLQVFVFLFALNGTFTCSQSFKQWLFLIKHPNHAMEFFLGFLCVFIVMDFLHQYVLLLIIQHLIQMVMHQLLIIVNVIIDSLHLMIAIYIVMKIQLSVWVQYIFYDVTRVLLLLLLLLLIKTIEISINIALIQLNYDVIQVFIIVSAIGYLIISIHCFKKSLITINYTNNKMECFLVLGGIFFVIFDTTQYAYERKNGSKRATNMCSIGKPNGRRFRIIIIDQIQALFTGLIWIQERTSIVFNVVFHIIEIKFKRNSCLDMNNHQKNFLNPNIIYVLISHVKCYKSSYKTL